MKFPDLLNSNIDLTLKDFKNILEKNEHLTEELSALLCNYDFRDPSLKSFLISICYTLVDLNIALEKPFKENVQKNISELIKNYAINKNDIKSIDQKIDKVLSLNWV